MTKSKHFTFVAVSMVVILLCIATWVSPVWASDPETAAPAASGTPSVQPGNPGITSSTEQEEIKSVIQTYFEIRYRAFNTLQLEGFGDLIATSPEGDILTLAEGDYTSLG